MRVSGFPLLVCSLQPQMAARHVDVVSLPEQDEGCQQLSAYEMHVIDDCVLDSISTEEVEDVDE